MLRFYDDELVNEVDFVVEYVFLVIDLDYLVEMDYSFINYENCIGFRNICVGDLSMSEFIISLLVIGCWIEIMCG